MIFMDSEVWEPSTSVPRDPEEDHTTQMARGSHGVSPPPYLQSYLQPSMVSNSYIEIESLKWKAVELCVPAPSLTPFQSLLLWARHPGDSSSLPSEVGGSCWAHSHLRDNFTGRPHHITVQKRSCFFTASLGPFCRSTWCLMWVSTCLSPQLWAKSARSMFMSLAGQLQPEFPRAPKPSCPQTGLYPLSLRKELIKSPDLCIPSVLSFSPLQCFLNAKR